MVVLDDWGLWAGWWRVIGAGIAVVGRERAAWWRRAVIRYERANGNIVFGDGLGEWNGRKNGHYSRKDGYTIPLCSTGREGSFFLCLESAAHIA